MFQNGHCRNTPVYQKIYAAWQRLPARPVLDGEPIYEDHPVCFNVKELGTSNAYDVRQYAWLDLFSGDFGHTYGCHDIWQFYSADHEAVNGPHLYWPVALELPGANQMKWVRRLMESHLPLTERVPDQSLIWKIISRHLKGYRLPGKGLFICVYGCGQNFTVVLEKITGKMLHVFWLNPRNGDQIKKEPILNKGTQFSSRPNPAMGRTGFLFWKMETKVSRLFKRFRS
jgi:hypothetical protein